MYSSDDDSSTIKSDGSQGRKMEGSVTNLRIIANRNRGLLDGAGKTIFRLSLGELKREEECVDRQGNFVL